MPLSPTQAQEVIEVGRSASALMAHKDFLAVVDHLTSLHLSGLVAAPPGDKGREAREYHHLMQYALTTLCQELKARADAGEQMSAYLAEEDND